ncbi:MAG: HDIG domain-containing protein, partial [Lachnospiraceae bacterium]|nr:HDIG domain-containing protein [Lachnospiraceae bacterium]
LKHMFSYHLILLGTVLCIFINLPYTPYILITMIITSLYGTKCGLVSSISVCCVLLLEDNDLYPIYMFGIAPIIMGAASTIAVWNKKILLKNILGTVGYILCVVFFTSFFSVYSKDSATIYEKPSFVIISVIVAIVYVVLGNGICILLEWCMNKHTPGLYLKKISEDTFPAVAQLKKSPTLYYHSTEVAEMARLAAKRIEADYELAYVGGLYHDIGKLVGQEYVKEGQKLADKYRLPQSVRNIMLEHNVKSRLPRTKEAAIVMLCDTAVSAVEYLKGTMDKKDMSETSIIENALNKRIISGALNKSGLTIEEFATVKAVLLKVKERQ